MILALLFRFYIKVYRTFRHARSYRIVAFPFGLLLKTGEDLYGHEADAIRFVHLNTSIPVPRVIASARGFGETYTLMTRVSGDVLAHKWLDLSPKERQNVRQLRRCIQELRELVPPSVVSAGAVCSLCGEPMLETRVASVTPFGPFVNERAFNDGLIRSTSRFIDPFFLQDTRKRMSDDHRIVFTHGDFAPRNILVRHDKVVAIVDWEGAGWRPEHWELVKALWSPGTTDKTWLDAVKQIIGPEYVPEWEIDCELNKHMEYAL